MTIEQLVEELKNPKYRDEEKKIEKVKSYLRTDYVEYHTKMAVSKQILEQSRYVDIGDKKVYSPNGALEYEIKVIAMIQIYYKDIELRDGEDRAVDFNLLEKNNLTGILLAAIGEDVTRFNAVYNMTADDLAYKESFVPWIDAKFDAFKIIIDKAFSVFDNEEIKAKFEQLVAGSDSNG